jgi:hypothetical protein
MGVLFKLNIRLIPRIQFKMTNFARQFLTRRRRVSATTTPTRLASDPIYFAFTLYSPFTHPGGITRCIQPHAGWLVVHREKKEGGGLVDNHSFFQSCLSRMLVTK